MMQSKIEIAAENIVTNYENGHLAPAVMKFCEHNGDELFDRLPDYVLSGLQMIIARTAMAGMALIETNLGANACNALLYSIASGDGPEDAFNAMYEAANQHGAETDSNPEDVFDPFFGDPDVKAVTERVAD